MEHVTQVVMTLVRDMGLLGYWVAFFAALAETLMVVGLLLPGSSFLLLMGVLSGQGVLDLGDLLIFAIAGATLGDNINFYLGRKYGQRWLSQERWFLKAEYLSKAEGFFERHGGKSVFLGRFVPSVKELMPFIAGMGQMGRGSFLVWNLLGAIGWALQWILPGYIFSQSLALAHAWLSRVGVLLVVLIALFALLYLIRWLVIRYGADGLRLAKSVSCSVVEAISSNPDVAAWSARHPRLIAFLKRRLDSSRLRGLPVTLVVLAMGYVLLLFGGLVEDLLVKEAVVAADVRVDSLIASFRTPVLNHLFYGITTLGNPRVVILAMVLCASVLWWRRCARFIVPMLASAGFADALTTLGKFALHRARPLHGLIEPGGYSFPSGHATISVAFYGFLFFILVHFSRGWRTRVNLVFVALLLALAIGFSRLYLGVHFLSDILAGYLVGSLGLLLGVAMSYTGWSGVHLHIHRLRTPKVLPPLVTVLVALTWSAVVIQSNLQPPFLGLTAEKPLASSQYEKPVQLFANANSEYAISVAGVRKAPINLVFQADPAVLTSCLQASGWHRAAPTDWGSVILAYRDAFLHRQNPAAPLAPWFWHDNPQTQQWSKPDGKDQVFDRHFLRIWQTPYYTPSGLGVYAASAGHEQLPAWHLVPQPDMAFDSTRKALVGQLRAAGGVVSALALTLPARRDSAGSGLVYEGERSLVTLKACHAPAK